MARAHGLTRAPRVRACKDRASAHRMTHSKVGDHIDASVEMLSWPKASIVDDVFRPRWANRYRLHPRWPVALILMMTDMVGAQLNSAPTITGSLIDSTVMNQVRCSTHTTQQPLSRAPCVLPAAWR